MWFSYKSKLWQIWTVNFKSSEHCKSMNRAVVKNLLRCHNQKVKRTFWMLGLIMSCQQNGKPKPTRGHQSNTDKCYWYLQEKTTNKEIMTVNIIRRNSKPYVGCFPGVMVKAMVCGIVVSEFEHQSCYHVHFRAGLGLGLGLGLPLLLF